MPKGAYPKGEEGKGLLYSKKEMSFKKWVLFNIFSGRIPSLRFVRIKRWDECLIPIAILHPLHYLSSCDWSSSPKKARKGTATAHT